MKLTKMNYEKAKAYRTLKEAIEAVEFEPEELAGEKLISVEVGIDKYGNRWYAVGSENEFTNCYYKDLQNVDEWFEERWMEKEERKIYTYTIESYEDLMAWLDSRKGDKRQVYYYGCWENFTGELYDIDDITSSATPEWFEDGATGEIYEFATEENI